MYVAEACFADCSHPAPLKVLIVCPETEGDVMSWLPKHLGNPGVDVRGGLDAAVIGGNIDS